MTERYNFFEFPHKPFRFMWMEVVMAAGSTNPTLDAAIDQLVEKMVFACDAYDHHNLDESEWFGPRLRELDAALADTWVHDHEAHRSVLEGLKTEIRAIRAETDHAARATRLRALYRTLTRFLEEDLAHMHLEQDRVMETFRAHYSDDQLRSLEAEFIRDRIDPGYMQSLTPLFLRAGNLDDRTFLLGIVKRQAPPQAFEDLLRGLVADVVGPHELAQLRARLAD